MRIVLCIAILMLTACTSQYDLHFSREHPESVRMTPYSRDGASEVLTGSWYVLPDSRETSILVDMIDGTSDRLWIMLYMWTELPSVTQAIRRAYERDVDVRIHLERTPYNMPWVNTNMIDHIREMDIPLTFSDPQRYAFTHAKFWIIDATVCVSTGNWTRSFFIKNREFVFCTAHDQLVEFLGEVFLSDAAWVAYTDTLSIPPFTVISPLNTRSRIRAFLQHAQHSLVFYTQTLDDAEVIELIWQAQNRGVSVRICTAKNTTNTTNRQQYPHFEWKEVRKPYLHAKVILRDDADLWMGSQNMTTNSIDNNREVGLLFQLDAPTHQQITQYIHQDCFSDTAE